MFIAVFELFPAAKRAAFEERIVRKLNRQLITKLLGLAILGYGLLISFPFIAPYLVAILVLLVYLANRLAASVSARDDTDMQILLTGLGCLSYLILLGLVVIIPGPLPDKVFWGSFSGVVLGAALAWSLSDSEGAKAIAAGQLGYFLVIGVPCGVGSWAGAESAATLFKPYEWLTRKVTAAALDPLVPDFTAQTIASSYQTATTALRALLPGIILSWKPFALYFLAADGYLVICTLVTQVLFVWFVLRLLLALANTVFFGFISMSKWFKKRLRLEDRLLIPIGGAILFIVGESLAFIAKTFNTISS